MVKNIAFDFDGTIADTIEHIFKIATDLLNEQGLPLPQKSLEEIRRMSVRNIIRELKIPSSKVPYMVKSISRSLREIEKVNPIKGIPQTLRILAQKYNLNIITSNDYRNVELFLKVHDLNIFSKVYSDSSIFGKHRVIKRFMKESNLTSKDLVYVGDEARDIEGAKKAGIKSIAVTWGLNSKKALEEHNPDFIIDSPDELLNLFL